MKRRLICLLLTAAMLLSLGPAVLADEFEPEFNPAEEPGDAFIVEPGFEPPADPGEELVIEIIEDSEEEIDPVPVEDPADEAEDAIPEASEDEADDEIADDLDAESEDEGETLLPAVGGEDPISDAEDAPYFFARLTEKGNLDFCVHLNGADEVVDADVWPRLLTDEELVTAHLVVGEEEFEYNILDYLRALPANRDLELPLPDNQPGVAGELPGVYDFQARLELTEDGVVVRLYFCAEPEAAQELVFFCGGDELWPEDVDSGLLWSVTVPHITVAELPADLLILGTNGVDEVSIRFSPICQAAMHWTELDLPLVLLCRALSVTAAETPEVTP